MFLGAHYFLAYYYTMSLLPTTSAPLITPTIDTPIVATPVVSLTSLDIANGLMLPQAYRTPSEPFYAPADAISGGGATGSGIVGSGAIVSGTNIVPTSNEPEQIFGLTLPSGMDLPVLTAGNGTPTEVGVQQGLGNTTPTPILISLSTSSNL